MHIFFIPRGKRLNIKRQSPSYSLFTMLLLLLCDVFYNITWLIKVCVWMFYCFTVNASKHTSRNRNLEKRKRFLFLLAKHANTACNKHKWVWLKCCCRHFFDILHSPSISSPSISSILHIYHLSGRTRRWGWGTMPHLDHLVPYSAMLHSELISL